MEQYVYCEGGKPVDVIDNRLAALARLTIDGLPLTQREMAAIKHAHEVGIAVGSSVLVVGYIPRQGWEKDRSITRIR